MPKRKVYLETGSYYHVFNRCISGFDLFWDESAYRRMQFALKYYSSVLVSCSISTYWDKSRDEREEIREAMIISPRRVNVLAYTLMPNHYHLLLRQEADFGISQYLHLLQTSFGHYFNKRQQRYGPIFAGQFKAVEIETEEQLLHTTRYIHLNPVTAYIVKNTSELINYPWSSWQEYAGMPTMFSISDPKHILDKFKNFEDYRQFCAAYMDYGRNLKEMEKIMIDA